MNFGGIAEEFSLLENSKVVVLPVPYDGTSTWIKGADKGPEAILEASANMELYDIETDSEVYKEGIFTAPPVAENTSPEDMYKAVYQAASDYIKRDKMLVTIGGEHSVSIGAIHAHAENFSKLTILQIDAHTDLRQEYEGSEYNHACVMARAREFCPIVQVGIRSMDIVETEFIDRRKIFYAHEIRHQKSWINSVISNLTENVYITIDLDGFDPSVMPSTGTPEPGGLLWYEVMDLLIKVNDNKNIVGFDVVELCPNPHHKASDFLAAKLIYRLLSIIFNKK